VSRTRGTHTEPFRVAVNNKQDSVVSTYKLWANKTLRIESRRRIYCFEDPPDDNDDLPAPCMVMQRTFAEDVAHCAEKLRMAATIILEDEEDINSDCTTDEISLALISIRELRILTAACGPPCERFKFDKGESTLQAARFEILILQGAIPVAIQILEKTQKFRLWRQAAEFLAEACFRSYPNSRMLIETGTFRTMLLHPKCTGSLLQNFIGRSLSYNKRNEEEPSLVKAGAIELIVDLMKKLPFDPEVQLRGIDLLGCCRSSSTRVCRSGGIAVLRHHATNISSIMLQRRARCALETAFDIGNPMIHDERLDFYRDLSEVQRSAVYE